jgi:polyhydroxybutyrate depolymerase
MKNLHAMEFKRENFTKKLREASTVTFVILIFVAACSKNMPAQEQTNEAGVTDAAAFLASPSASLPPVGWSAGDHLLTLNHDGMERSYILHIPSGYDGTQPVPLVLAFHGISLDAGEMIRISGLNAQADKSGFIAVYPNGSGEVQAWNGGHCCGLAAREQVDDAGFVRALIADIESKVVVDPRRVYATGFSNGAIFTYKLACELADLLAAVGPVSATPVVQDLQACQPSRPVPVMHFHGTADDANPYNGGTANSGIVFTSVATSIQEWVGLNSCPSLPESSTQGSIQHDVYAPCASGSAIELYTINGGKHAWPGGEAVNLAMGEPTMEISASALLWEFFSAHPMP